MVWEIIAFGDVTSLNLTFNAIASIFADGGYKSAAIAVVLFVVVGQSLKSLTDGKQELPYAKMLAAVIVYMMGFNTFTTVSIENRYDSTVTKIDNIPVAVAVPASLISQVGLYMAETVETAFGNTGSEMERVSQSGYLSPLKLLAQYRERTMYRCPAGEAASTGNGINLCLSLSNYIAECAMVKANRDNAYLSMSEEDYLTALQFDSEAFATEMITSSGVAVTKSCKDAYALIKGLFDSNTFDTMVEAATSTWGSGAFAQSGIERTGDAIQAIGIDSGKSRNLLQTMFMRKAAEEGELQFYYSNGASDLAENLNSSIEQRNYAWALQGEMWIQIVDMILSIMECLIYALAPFIGLMVLTGSLGAKSFLLYLQMLAVIQLMPAMQVIVQNIILSNMIDYTTQLAAQYEVGSMDFEFRLLDKAKELLGFGGMASAIVVPAMAMSLITGSGMAMMGALKSAAATPKDTDAVPDTVGQGGATVNLGPMNTADMDAYGNRISQSASNRIGNITKGLSASNDLSGATQRKNTAQQAYSTARSDINQSSNGTSYDTAATRSASTSLMGSSKTIDSWAEKQVNSLSNSKDLTDTQRNELKQSLVTRAQFGVEAGFQATVGANIPFTETGLKGHAGASAKAGMDLGDSNEHGRSTSSAVKEGYNELTSGEKGKQLTASFQEAKEIARSKKESYTTKNDAMDSKIKKSEAAYSELQSAEDSYASSQKLSNTIGLMNSDQATAIHSTSRSDKVMRSAEMDVLDWDDRKQALFTKTLSEFEGGVNGTKMDEKSAFLAAYMATNQYYGDQQQTLDTLSKYEGNQLAQTDELAKSTLAPTDNTHDFKINPDTGKRSIEKDKDFEAGKEIAGNLEPKARENIKRGNTKTEDNQEATIAADKAKVSTVAEEGITTITDKRDTALHGTPAPYGPPTVGFVQNKEELDKKAQEEIDKGDVNKTNLVSQGVNFAKDVGNEGLNLLNDSSEKINDGLNILKKD